MTEYSFITIWKLTAPVEKVWMEIKSINDWPQWWKQVEEVTELEKGQDNGLNSAYRITFKSALPYSLQFQSRVVKVDELKLIDATVVGELQGKGIWSFHQQDGLTIVRYDWIVKTNKWWMNILAPVARPVFVWNHDYIMKRGGESLAKRLNCELK